MLLQWMTKSPTCPIRQPIPSSSGALTDSFPPVLPLVGAWQSRALVVSGSVRFQASLLPGPPANLTSSDPFDPVDAVTISRAWDAVTSPSERAHTRAGPALAVKLRPLRETEARPAFSDGYCLLIPPGAAMRSSRSPGRPIARSARELLCETSSPMLPRNGDELPLARGIRSVASRTHIPLQAPSSTAKHPKRTAAEELYAAPFATLRRRQANGAAS